jgi:hypothetical protein
MDNCPENCPLCLQDSIEELEERESREPDDEPNQDEDND